MARRVEEAGAGVAGWWFGSCGRLLFNEGQCGPQVAGGAPGAGSLSAPTWAVGGCHPAIVQPIQSREVSWQVAQVTLWEILWEFGSGTKGNT